MTRSAPPFSIPECVVVVIAFSAATALLTFPLVFHATRALPSDLVDTLLNAWIISWDAQSLAHGLRGLWQAPIFFPYHDTLAFSENLLGLGFLVAPVYWISRNAVLTYNVAFLASFVCAGVGMYLLVRSLTGSRAAAAVAGAAYAFGPFRMAQIAHIQMVATGWMPVALWALHEYFSTRARRWLALFVAAAALQMTSNIYVGYFMLVPCTIVVAYELWKAPSGRARASLELLAAGVAIAVVLSPVAAAYLRVRTSYAQTRSVQEILSYSAQPQSYLVGKTTIGVWRWLPTAVAVDPEKELFPGLFLAALAAAGIRRRSWPYVAIALAGFVFSLGPRGHAYNLLLAVVPGANGMRAPARFAIVVMLALSVLAGYGVAALLARVRPRWRWMLATACVVAVIADGWSAPIPIEAYEAKGRVEDRTAAQWLSAQPPGAVLHLPVRTNNFQELNYQYATLAHGHAIVNGYSGFTSPLQDSLRADDSPLAEPKRFAAAIASLRAIGVRYLVVHWDDFNSRGQAAWTVEQLHRSPQIESEAELPGLNAFVLAP